MNIHNALLKEHSRVQMEKIAKYIGDDAERFAQLMNEFLYAPYRISQWAAYVMSISVEKYPMLIEPWWRLLLDNLNKPVHDAVIRNTVRIWQHIELPEEYMGEVYDRCVQYLNDHTRAIAIRAFSLTVAARIAVQYPELKKEVMEMAKAFTTHTSPALKVRGRDALKFLAK